MLPAPACLEPWIVDSSNRFQIKQKTIHCDVSLGE